MNVQILYATKRGAGAMLFPKTQEQVQDALQRLARRHIEADLVDGVTHERIGGVEPVEEGRHMVWNWWFDPDRIGSEVAQ